MSDADFEKVGALIDHSRRCGCPEEASVSLGIAEGILSGLSAGIQRERIVARASEAHERADLLEKFRGLLAYAQAHKSMSPAGERLLAIVQQVPERPKKSLSAEGSRFFGFFTKNNQEISALIQQL